MGEPEEIEDRPDEVAVTRVAAAGAKQELPELDLRPG
jgi:hypothetical protein